MNIFVVKLFRVNCCQRRVKVFNLVATGIVQVSAVSSHCATTKEVPTSKVNFLYK